MCYCTPSAKIPCCGERCHDRFQIKVCAWHPDFATDLRSHNFGIGGTTEVLANGEVILTAKQCAQLSLLSDFDKQALIKAVSTAIKARLY